jgi:hypothetical protein
MVERPSQSQEKTTSSLPRYQQAATASLEGQLRMTVQKQSDIRRVDLQTIFRKKKTTEIHTENRF